MGQEAASWGEERRKFRAVALLSVPMLALPAILFLLVLFVYPLARFLARSLSDGQSFTFEHYEAIFSSSLYVDVLGITFQIAILTTLFSLLVGYPLAYFVANAHRSRQNMLLIWILIPLWTSFLVRTFAWIVLLGRRGPINDLLLKLGVDEPVSFLYNLNGVLIGMVHALMPFAIITMISVMQGIDRRLPAAAGTLGAPPSQSFWRIYFPLSMPGVAAGGLLVFITALGFFITPAFLGGATQTMIAQVILSQVNQLLNWGFAGALSVLLLVSTLLAVALFNRVFGSTGVTSGLGGDRTVARVGFDNKNVGRPGVIRQVTSSIRLSILDTLLWITNLCETALERLVPRERSSIGQPIGTWMIRAIAVLAIIYLIAPLLVVIPISLSSANSLTLPPEGLSLRWYEAFLTSSPWIAATVNSLKVGFLTAVLATLLGTPAAFALTRGRFRGKGILLGLILSPVIFPRIIIAVALFYLYAELRLVGTTLGLVLGHTILAIPYVVISVSAVLKSYDVRLDQAGMILGANPWRVFWHITLPLIRPGLISAWLFSFIVSFDELTLALFVTGGLFTTLPRKMWDEMLLQVSPTLAAVSTLLIAVIIIVLTALELVRRRSVTAAS